jgi:hypothetical protein
LLLRQLDLEYFVCDGVVFITHPGSQSVQSTICKTSQRVGHCVIALLAACVGCCASAVVGRSRD